MRKSFILHIDSLSILAKMPDDMAGKFIKLIYHFQLTGELLEMDFALEMAITPFINQFQRDNNNYVKTCETNRLNGLNGGRPKKQQQPIESEKTDSVILEPKKPYNDSDSNNDSDNENKNDTDIENTSINDIIIIENEFSPKPKVKTFKQWSLEDFQNSIESENETSLEKKDLIEFYDYWRELTPSGKMNFQTQKSWQTELRLKTWERNKDKFSSKTKPTQQAQKEEMKDAFISASIKMRERAAEKWGVNQK